MLLVSCATPRAVPAGNADALEQLRLDAQALHPLMKSALGRAFLAGTSKLTRPTPRTLYQNPKTGRVVTKEGFERLDQAQRADLVQATPAEVDVFFYNTYHGTPLAYSRPMDLLGADGLEPTAHARVADFGFGSIGQLRMMASLGFVATGIDINPLLGALYGEPGDQGPFETGEVKVLIGKFPSDEILTKQLGTGLDVFIAKNTLKKGYIHPDRTPGKPEWVMHLDASDEEFLRAVHDALKPNGRFLIYNICPAPTPEGQPFVTWSDGRSPFTSEQFERAGFRVKAFDVDDTAFVREMGHRLRWDAGEEKMDLINDLSVLYTLVERD
jgi:SAM-dependent methyltransferase